MNDDYLWDGSGEPDPEVERLENLLSRYRHQPAPFKMPVDQRRSIWSRLYSSHLVAAAALALIFLVAALSYFMLRQGDGASGQSAASPLEQNEQATGESAIARDVDKDADKDIDKEIGKDKGSEAHGQPERAASRAHPRRERKTSRSPERAFPDSRVAEREIAREREDVSAPRTGGVFDGGENVRVMTGSAELLEAEAARHFEKAQVLLRSFRNAPVGVDGSPLDVSYEREKSRSLLYKNIVLRRGVEARRLYPIEEVLSSLEPILIDIANLPEKPSADEVNSIRQRMQRKEIVATLQVYSAQASLAGL